MPQQTPSSEQDRKSLTVEQLLRLKRAEQPDPAFWSKFDTQMQQRMLQALVAKRRSAPRRAWNALGALRYATVPGLAAALAVVGIALNKAAPDSVLGDAVVAAAPAAQPMSMIMQVQAPAASHSFVAQVDASASQHFVVDSLRLDPPSSGYMKVMASEALTINPGSTRYVADQLGSAASRFLVATTSY